MKKAVTLFFLLITLCASITRGQTLEGQSPNQKYERLNIGDKVPAAIWNKIPKTKTTKLIILDFWNTYCSGCFASFPKMKKLQEKFSKELQIVLVNYEKGIEIKNRLEKINKHKEKDKQLALFTVSITGDTVLRKLFPHSGDPHHIWLSKEGKVLAITYAYNATDEHVQSFINGKKLNLSIRNDTFSDNLTKFGLARSNYSFLSPHYYSLFSYYDPNTGFCDSMIEDKKAGIFRKSVRRHDVLSLFKMAYNFPKRILVEVNNWEKYQQPQDGNLIDGWLSKYTFSYELQGSLGEKDRWQLKMQEDINYHLRSMLEIEGGLEKRMLKSLILIKDNISLFPVSKSNEEELTSNDSLLMLENVPFSKLLDALTFTFENMSWERPFLNETLIDLNLKVDILLTGNLKDLENVRKQLRLYGLNIVEAVREVEVLVISDKKVE